MDLEFIEANANVPLGVVTSTARKGDKWSKQAKPGDMVHLKITESARVFGRAVVVGSELTTYGNVIDRAGENIVAAFASNEDEAKAALASGLAAAYGDDLKLEDPFTVLSFIVVNEDRAV